MPGTTLAAPSDAVPRYDDSRWPLFAIVMPPQRLSPASFAAHLAVCRSVFERREHFLMLVDMSEHPSFLPSQRSALTESMRTDGERYPGLCRGVAVVVSSSFERSVAQAIGTMSNVQHPVRVFASVDEARAWLSTLVLPPSAPPSRTPRGLVSPLGVAREIVSPPSSRRIEPAAPSSVRHDLASGVVPGPQRNVTRRPSSAET